MTGKQLALLERIIVLAGGEEPRRLDKIAALAHQILDDKPVVIETYEGSGTIECNLFGRHAVVFGKASLRAWQIGLGEIPATITLERSADDELLIRLKDASTRE